MRAGEDRLGIMKGLGAASRYSHILLRLSLYKLECLAVDIKNCWEQ
jgi:hypothetical protein